VRCPTSNHRGQGLNVYEELLSAVNLALAALEAHSTDSTTLALHDPLYAMASELSGEQPRQLRGLGQALALALEHDHPEASVCRKVMAELAALGLWSPVPKSTPMDLILEGIGTETGDPEAGAQLEKWIQSQELRMNQLQRSNEALKYRLARTERFSGYVAAIALLLGAGLILGLFATSGMQAPDPGLLGPAMELQSP
jgi:hypothetical protein